MAWAISKPIRMRCSTLEGAHVPAHCNLYTLYKILYSISSHIRIYRCTCIHYVWLFHEYIYIWSNSLSSFRKRHFADMNCRAGLLRVCEQVLGGGVTPLGALGWTWRCPQLCQRPTCLPSLVLRHGSLVRVAASTVAPRPAWGSGRRVCGGVTRAVSRSRPHSHSQQCF